MTLMQSTISTGNQIVRNGLVLWLDASNYPGSGTTWTDISGLGNSGTLTNGPTYSSNNSGSIVFDGVNDYVRINSSSITNLVNNFSTEIWYKSNNNNANLFYSRYPAGGFIIGGIGGGNWKITKYTVVDIYAGIVPANSNWHQVICIFSSTGSFVYVDGILSGSSADSANLVAPSSGYFDIGVAEFGYHNGSIGSVKVYNRALSATEITQNFNALRGRYGI